MAGGEYIAQGLGELTLYTCVVYVYAYRYMYRIRVYTVSIQCISIRSELVVGYVIK